MKLERFFDKFDQFAEATNAVQKMRELVLQLAMQGKLAEQKPGDGDTAELLLAISRERDPRANKLRIPEGHSSTDGDAHLFQIPANWAWTKLGTIALQIQYGYTASADSTVNEIRMLRITDIQNNQVDWPSVPGCQIDQGEAEKYLLSKNDILIARTGGTIGKSFIVPDAPVKSVFASYLIRITPPRSLVARYLKAFLESPLYWRQLREMSAGTGQPNVNGQALGRLEIPLPPLAEQKRIVAKVDELMALCDRLEAQQQERDTRHAALARASLARFAEAPTPANLDFLFHNAYTITPADLRKSILTLAAQGKLVPQDPNDESAQELVVRVASEKARLVQNKVIKSEQQSVPISDEEALFPIPGTWTWLRAGDLCRPISSGSTPDQSVFHPSEGIPYLKVYNIRNQVVDFDYKRQFIDLNHHNERMKRSKLLPGDVIMNIVGPPLGKVAIVPDTFAEWNCNQAIAFFRPIFSEFALYLYTFLKEGSFLQNIQLIGTAGQDNISVTKCKFIPIALPPLAEQHRIVAKVDQLMAWVDQLETQLTASRATAEKLMQAVVAELTISA